MFRYCLFMLFSLTIVFTGCQKKSYIQESVYQINLSPAAQLLASYTWKERAVVMYKSAGKDTLVYNLSKQLELIDKDDLTLFREDGTYLFEEGQTKFTPQSSQKYVRGTWQLADDKATLTLTAPKSSNVYQIVQLDTTQLVLKLTVTKEQQAYYYLLTYEPVAKTAFGEQKTQTAANNVYTQADQQPQYPGGHAALLRFLNNEQKYPPEARKKGIEGKVVVKFVISPEGKPEGFTITEGLGYGCDEAVLQTCRSMNKWEPGLVNGKPVPVQVTLPVVFKL